MIEINGKQFRNLEEQVLYLSQMIERILETNVLLAQFGIKVIDQVNNESELFEKYPRTTFQGDYGDAVLVGAQPPYDYYIWTRPFDEEVYGDWFNIGQFPLPGPKGDTGATGQTGARGQRGNKWYTGTGAPSATIADVISGDLYLDTNTDRIYRYASNYWTIIASIKGNPGDPGAVGPQGPAGPIVDLVGVITSVDQLPDNIAEFIATYGRQGAYLIGPDDPNVAKYVWGLTGTDDNLQWTDLGLFATGTIIYVNGQPVETLEMNNYVPKLVDASSTYSVSVYNKNRSQYEPMIVSQSELANSIARRGTNGVLYVGNPTLAKHAANKAYVDEKVASVGGGGSGTPERYHREINMSWREYVEDPDTGEGYDDTIIEAPQYIELKAGMEFDLVTAIDSQDYSWDVGLYADLVANTAAGAAFYTIYNGEDDGHTQSTHQGVAKYHVVVAKQRVYLAAINQWADWLAPEITAYYNDGTVRVVCPEFGYTAGEALTLAQANLKLQFYGYPTYQNRFFYFGNTEPNVQLSEIK